MIDYEAAEQAIATIEGSELRAEDWHRAITAFENDSDSAALDKAVQAYHLGLAEVKRGARAPEYLSRFSVAYQRVRSGK